MHIYNLHIYVYLYSARSISYRTSLLWRITKATNNIAVASYASLFHLYVRARARVFFFSFFFNSVVLSVVAATVRNAYTNRPRLVITRFIEKRRLLTRSLKRPVFIKSLNFICQSPCFINPPVHSVNRQPCVCVCMCVCTCRFYCDARTQYWFVAVS